MALTSNALRLRSLIVFLCVARSFAFRSLSARARPVKYQWLSATDDFIDPVVRGANFGDPLNSYWGAGPHEATFGVKPVMASGCYEVVLDKPLGIVFEEVRHTPCQYSSYFSRLNILLVTNLPTYKPTLDPFQPRPY